MTPSPEKAGVDLTKVPLNEYGYVQTVSGFDVKVVAFMNGGSCPVVCVYRKSGIEDVSTWTATGQFKINGPCGFDLIPVPKKIVVDAWINVYPGGELGGAYRTPREVHADAYGRIACIHITREVTEGEGLDQSDGSK